MMDVIQSRACGEEMEEKLSSLSKEIQTYVSQSDTVYYNTEKRTQFIHRLMNYERDVLSSDWGGYCESYRRPFIQRIDSMLLSLDDHIPTRPDYVFKQPRESFLEKEQNGVIDIYTRQYTNYAQLPTYNTYNNINTASIIYHNANNININNTNTNTTNIPNTSSCMYTLPLFITIPTPVLYEQENCSICLSPFQSKDNTCPTYLICKHRFHTQCIKKWYYLNKHEKTTCPICNHCIFTIL